MPQHLRSVTIAPPRPAVLHAAVARLDGPSSEVMWDGRGLVYRAWRGDRPAPPHEIPLFPGPDAWYRFWAAVDGLSVWDWDGRYDALADAGVAGPGWILRLARGHRSVDVSGFAAFPDGAPGRPGPCFRRLCRELSVLVGGRAIG